MKTHLFTLLLSALMLTVAAQPGTNPTKPDQTIFVYGGDIQPKFVEYAAGLTGKPNPKICYIPTASADNERNIKYWDIICRSLPVEPYVLKVWLSSDTSNRSFADILLSMDAIVVGGGNTLNMLGIWKAQGIDTLLRQALEKGIVLSGGSAGSICWFENGISDSRPVNLSVVQGLSFLPYSNCPHYKEKKRRELYLENMNAGAIGNGYGCDYSSGILFVNGKFVRSVSAADQHYSWFVTSENGKIHEEKLPTEILVRKNALPETAYEVSEVGKPVKDFQQMNSQDTPLHAFISIRYLFANGRQSQYKSLSGSALKPRLNDNEPDKGYNEKEFAAQTNTFINKVLIYNNRVAGVINKMYDDFYGLWFFCYEDGRWLSAGEDYGGETPLDAEITFREKAATYISETHK